MCAYVLDTVHHQQTFTAVVYRINQLCHRRQMSAGEDVFPYKVLALGVRLVARFWHGDTLEHCYAAVRFE